MAAAEIAVVGFGEAGTAFARGWNLPRDCVRAYDIKSADPATAAAMDDVYRQAEVSGAPDLGRALAQVGQVFCLVPADQARAAAAAAVPCLAPGAYWIDGTSSSPGAKNDSAAMIEAVGAHYVDMAIMAPVLPRLHRTPILLSGPHAGKISSRLAALGMDARVAGDRVGDASAIKMIRSIMVKGLEALTTECFLAARKAGVEDEVLASFRASDPSVDWQARANYNLERMMAHGRRRAAEMREVSATLTELGLSDRMSAAAAQWQDEVAALGLHAVPDDPLTARLDSLLAKLA